MAPKKAAPKKATKKTAKKAAKKTPGHHPQKDLRRAYEHLGRVHSLMQCLPLDAQEPVQRLVTAARAAVQSNQSGPAADLLRASEHYAFGSLNLADEPDRTVAADLRQAIEEEFRHLVDRAQHHGEPAKSTSTVSAIYSRMQTLAGMAMSSKRYRAALEFARGAEALCHLDPPAAPALHASPRTKRLDD